MTKDEAIDLLRDALEHYNRLAPDTITAREALRMTASLAPSSEPVGTAWFHRGMVNFDAEDTLAALDDGKGTPIKLYAEAPAAPVVVPEGWKLVPERVTYKMKRAGGAFQRSPPWVGYEAMLDAAPAAPLNTQQATLKHNQNNDLGSINTVQVAASDEPISAPLNTAAPTESQK